MRLLKDFGPELDIGLGYYLDKDGQSKSERSNGGSEIVVLSYLFDYTNTISFYCGIVFGYASNIHLSSVEPKFPMGGLTRFQYRKLHRCVSGATGTPCMVIIS